MRGLRVGVFLGSLLLVAACAIDGVSPEQRATDPAIETGAVADATPDIMAAVAWPNSVYWDLTAETLTFDYVARISTAPGTSSMPSAVTATLAQTGFGPAELFGPPPGWVFLTRGFGSVAQPYVQFTTDRAITVSAMRFRHFHNHSFGVIAAYPSYQVRIQIQRAGESGWTTVGSALTVSISNYAATDTIAFTAEEFAAGTHKIRWYPEGLKGGYTHTRGDWFAVRDVEMRFDVPKAAGAVTISNIPGSATVGGSFTPTFTALGDGVVTVHSKTTSQCTVSAENVVSFVGAGDCTVYAEIAEGSEYLAATGDDQTFTVQRAATTLQYTGAQIVVKPTSIELKATVSSALAACANARDVTFTVSNGDASETRTVSSVSGVATGLLSSSGLTEGAYDVTVTAEQTSQCAADEYESTLLVTEPGQSAYGAGWLSLGGIASAGNGRLHFAFSVRLKKGTGGTTLVPAQYSGHVLILNNEAWRCAGDLNAFGVTSGQGSALGVCDLERYDATLNDGLGDWVPFESDVPIRLDFKPAVDGKGKTKTAAQLGVVMTVTPAEGSNTVPQTAMTGIRSGNIHMAK